jgi:hypothetical protein
MSQQNDLFKRQCEWKINIDELRQRPVAGYCEHCNEPLGSTKGGGRKEEFRDLAERLSVSQKGPCALLRQSVGHVR